MKVQCDEKGILKASKVIKNGGIVVYPTDTVYGIGCNPYLKESVDRIYKIKGRDRSKPLPLLVYSVETAEKIVFFDEKTRKIIKKFWPGALTVLLKITDQKLKESLGIKDKIAIRIPNSKCALDLLQKTDFLVGTSANVSGEEPFTNPEDCSAAGLAEDCEIFVDTGAIKSRGESTIIEVVVAEGGGDDQVKILREGAISREEILGI